MPAIYNQITCEWIDTSGRPATSFMTTQDQDSGAADAYNDLAVSLQACSDAKLTAIQFIQTLVYSGTPLSGPYATVLDRASMLGKITDTGRPYRISIVGPKASILMPGHSYVDLENADILDLQLNVELFLGDTTGHACGPFTKGVRQMARGN